MYIEFVVAISVNEEKEVGHKNGVRRLGTGDITNDHFKYDSYEKW